VPEGLITLERVTQDGTKIKASAGGNSFRRQEKIAVHLAAAREQVRVLNAQAADEEKLALGLLHLQLATLDSPKEVPRNSRSQLRRKLQDHKHLSATTIRPKKKNRP
jgi:hypothetical protein